VSTCLPYAALIWRLQLESRPLVAPQIQRKFSLHPKTASCRPPRNAAEFLTDYVANDGGVVNSAATTLATFTEGGAVRTPPP
jgi:hypothetical protein